jgi:hypothetical protein
MTQDKQPTRGVRDTDVRMPYGAPEMQYLGTLAELTQFLPPPGKEVGGADGVEVLGLDVGPVSRHNGLSVPAGCTA